MFTDVLCTAHSAAASCCESENQADRELMEVRESVLVMQNGFMGYRLYTVERE